MSRTVTKAEWRTLVREARYRLARSAAQTESELEQLEPGLTLARQNRQPGNALERVRR
jgi:hypothetical protein